jgi:hypothetical protein
MVYVLYFIEWILVKPSPELYSKEIKITIEIPRILPCSIHLHRPPTQVLLPPEANHIHLINFYLEYIYP